MLLKGKSIGGPSFKLVRSHIFCCDPVGQHGNLGNQYSGGDEQPDENGYHHRGAAPETETELGPGNGQYLLQRIHDKPSFHFNQRPAR